MPPLTVLIANATLATLTGTETYIIHRNHNTETITALLHFEKVPAVFYCHSWTDWISSPPDHPRILAYVAVDDTCRDRLVFETESQRIACKYDCTVLIWIVSAARAVTG